MAITNVISNSANIFKDIIVKNSTNKNLNNIYITNDCTDRPLLKISDLPKGQQLKKSVLIKHIINSNKLLLVTENNDEEQEITSFDTSYSTDVKTLTLTIKEIDDNLIVSASEN